MSNDFLIESGTVTADYAVASDGRGPRFPWLQASLYKPSSIKTRVELGLVRDSINIVQNPSLENALDWTSTSYDEEGTEVEFGCVTDNVRWIVLARPRMFGLVKADGKVVPLRKGMKERGEVTVSQVLLACIAGTELVKDSDGNPQIFTLKLRSSKTGLIGSEQDKDFGVTRNNGHRTIAQLNATLVAKSGANPGSWMAHTTSVQFSAIAEKFESRATGDSSLGVRFIFADGSGCRPLNPEALKEIHTLVVSPDFKTLAADPFAKPEPKAETYTYVVFDDSGLDSF